jgi:H+-translocating NAD(P) transhydrogenase subunit alpha
MKIAILRETADAEPRVAATPETVKKLIGLGASVAVEAGAGAQANIADAAFGEAGASVGDRAAAIGDADLVLGVQGPAMADLPGIKAGATLAAILSPFADRARIDCARVMRGMNSIANAAMPPLA